MPIFYLEAGDTNSGPHTQLAATLLIELPPQAQSCHLSPAYPSTESLKSFFLPGLGLDNGDTE